jgi:CheY-like chemotaxis protein
VKRLLVIEDGTEYAEFARTFLGEWEIRTASSANEALAELASRGADALLLDLRFDRAGREQLVGDLAETAVRLFSGDGARALRHVQDQQGTLSTISSIPSGRFEWLRRFAIGASLALEVRMSARALVVVFLAATAAIVGLGIVLFSWPRPQPPAVAVPPWAAPRTMMATATPPPARPAAREPPVPARSRRCRAPRGENPRRPSLRCAPRRSGSRPAGAPRALQGRSGLHHLRLRTVAAGRDSRARGACARLAARVGRNEDYSYSYGGDLARSEWCASDGVR